MKVKTFTYYLKFQFSVCTERWMPISHLAFLFFSSWITNSFIFVARYVIISVFIVGMFLLNEIYPGFNDGYIAFLTKHSDRAIYDIYCGNPGGHSVKLAIGPKGMSLMVQNGSGKILFGCRAGGLGVLTAEHVVTHTQINEVFQYQHEKYLTGGVHPSNKPFCYGFKSETSIIDTCVGKKSTPIDYTQHPEMAKKMGAEAIKKIK